ncbi:TDT family transporter [Marinomonas pollencensis]|uniref:Tellurite resistance protein TehA-like permease n=1 Tax=Marinomonas pollencensis TaxID=491954 RepID=A0A3E0DP99_9GAMM|nr:TDT family transporter [Marinomonas pollencensis]REG83675.1 tellurite resistance protein TehA-like permease [Marinomonas pollencensis]
MLKRVRDLASIVPSSMAGLALGIGGLGRLWSLFLNNTMLVQYAAALIASLLLLIVLLKFVLHPALLGADLRDPIQGSSAPTFAMALMVVSLSLDDLLPDVGVVVWGSAVLLHCVLLGSFVYHRVKHFHMLDMAPSWFVPFAGIALAAASFPVGFQRLAEGIWWFAFVGYLLLVPLMLYRLLYGGALREDAKPTLAVLAAPASVCLTGYLTISELPSEQIVALLLIMALIKTSVVYGFSIYLIRLPFSPSYASFTFPLVISAIALLKAQQHYILWQGNEFMILLLKGVGMVELLIASLVVAYVSACYLRYYFFTLRRKLAFA